MSVLTMKHEIVDAERSSRSRNACTARPSPKLAACFCSSRLCKEAKCDGPIFLTNKLLLFFFFLIVICRLPNVVTSGSGVFLCKLKWLFLNWGGGGGLWSGWQAALCNYFVQLRVLCILRQGRETLSEGFLQMDGCWLSSF
ncbi:hypothetical protein IscW_ISCW015966 [Ixodes scapularis]|uniref:Uncharacterized protein n=1 Tax=Ixodes scapularis TaxID=6945 RepID=B7P3M7_IXOSC|nr:hypothetical protein IscW_ISCW015966 [Ixodes scapularis]|eukprot:XP_002404431.1 hypothetical protein IscW_ISCW015966 [Ixodes scapularis]